MIASATTHGALAAQAMTTARIAEAIGRSGPRISRPRMFLIVAAIGGILMLRALSQVVAMGLAADGARDRMELAAKLDPGSYRIHIALAQSSRRAGRPHTGHVVFTNSGTCASGESPRPVNCVIFGNSTGS